MRVSRPISALAIAALLGFSVPAFAQKDRIAVLAGPEPGIQASMARDLVSVIGSAAGGKMVAVATEGTVDTLLRMRDETGTRLGIVTEDVAAVYNAAAARGFGGAASLIAPIRAMATLNRLSFHFLVRADATYSSFDSIRGARINLGPIKGTTALPVMNYYLGVFGESISDDKVSFLGHEEALAKLVTDRTVDVVAIVSEQPVRILADMRADARRYVRLLPAQPVRILDAKSARAYSAERLYARHYPSLLDADADSVAVRAVLAYHEIKRGDNDLKLATFARAFCDRLSRLKRDGHPSWREVTLAPPDPGMGWHYASPLIRGEIGRCGTGEPVIVPAPACTAAERVLRICD